MSEEFTPKLRIQKLTFSSVGKEVILLRKGNNILQGLERYGDGEFEPFDLRHLEHSLKPAIEDSTERLEKAGIEVEELKAFPLPPVKKKPIGDPWRAFHKGERCWIKPDVICQEGFCARCSIFVEAKLCLDCWEERKQKVKLERDSSGRFICPECGREYLFEE